MISLHHVSPTNLCFLNIIKENIISIKKEQTNPIMSVRREEGWIQPSPWVFFLNFFEIF